MVIAHNLASMNAQRQYGIVTDRRAKTTEKLSSGYRVNRAADDAAGLQISEKMRNQVRGLNQGSENIQNGISLVQIADGALAEVNDMLHRMTELSVKAANGTNTSQDRQAIQHEITHLISEIDRISQSTEYNTMPIFDRQKWEHEAEDVSDLVKTPTAKTGYLTESYEDSAGKWHPAAVLDFSGIDSSNISQLYDKGFSFNCSMGCSEVFKFKFINGDGTQSSVDKLTMGGTHNYKLDIGGLTTGQQIVDKMYNYIWTNHPTGSAEASLIDGAVVSHSNALTKTADNNKIIIYSYKTATNEAGALNYYKNTKSGIYGAVDCSQIAGSISKDPQNHFWIQCSGVPGDGLDIKTERINSKILGIKNIDVSTFEGAKEALEPINQAGLKVSSIRSSLGAYQNRLEHSYDNNMNKAENTQAAESRIRDTDMASEMVRLSKDNILEQVGNSIMAQANQSNQGVLSILGA